MNSRSSAFGGGLAVLALVLTGVLFNVQTARSSDHQDSPTTVARPAADITDVFVYPAGDNPANVVLQMDLDPLLTPATAPAAALDPGVLYQFKIAHGTNAGVEDMVIQLQASGAGASQTVNVYGPFTPSTTGVLSSVNTAALAGSVAFGSATAAPLTNGMRVFVGPRADPFFFDLFAFFAFLPDRNYQTAGSAPKAPFSFLFPAPAGVFASCKQGTPSDALSANSFNVLSIVIEAPRTLIAPASGSQKIHLWTTTSTQSGA
ncbi:MAG: hypothetical protein QOF71_3440 [Candidatus Eremiobacteraeota bacterium]|jgi:hypothetical protein|nr:hypothetical protein [Candidatus Eremiobacteraeota bacterium]